MIKEVNYFDYFQVIKILSPYINQLEAIYKAYLNGDFEGEDLDYKDPFEVIRFYFNTSAYKSFNINELAFSLKEKLSSLDIKDYTFKDYIRIEETYGSEIPHEFDERWTLKDVYKYLVGLVNTEGIIIMENSIVNGEILNIFKCLIIRV